MKTLVVPTDFSPVSLNAIEYAANMALKIRASLSLIYVCPLPMSFGEVPAPSFQLNLLVDDATTRIRDLKSHLSRKFGEALKIYTEVKIGHVITELNIFCAAVKPYAVIMGSHGESASSRILFGSNTIDAMRHLAWPLMVIPREAKFHEIERVGFACDFKEVTDTAPIDEIKWLVREFDAELHVIYINKENYPNYSDELIEESGMLQEMLDDLDPKYHFVTHPDINEGLSKFAEEFKLDVLIVVPHKHGIVERIFNQDHTRQLLLHTHLPVMAVHD